MTVRSKLCAALAFVTGLFVAGCGGGDRAPVVAETDDASFRSGQQLVRQGRDAEALSMFLKVIERRGEQASAESHLEAGLIYLRHVKNPIYAIYHFQKYLELQPNTKQASGVRGLIDTAKREFARTLPGRPLDSQVVGLDQSDRIKLLEREVEDLKAENAVLRSLAPAPATRVSRSTIDFNEPAPTTQAAAAPPVANAPIQLRIAEVTRPPVIAAPPKSAPSVPPPTARKNAANVPAAKKHTVGPGDTLYNIAKKYGVTMEAIVAANHDLLPTVASPLRKGAELKIP